MVGIGLNSKEMANFIVFRYTIKIKHVQYNSNWYKISGTCSSEANLNSTYRIAGNIWREKTLVVWPCKLNLSILNP